MFIAKNLCKSFHGKPILKEISFEQPSGSIGVFVGPSGCGKSTLFRVLNNLESLDAGSFFLGEAELLPSMLHSKHLMTMVFQGFESFNHLNVFENIMIGLRISKKIPKNIAEKITDELIEKYHLKNQEKLYPIQLSGGQKQRLAIARAIAIQPKIICMDEPTSALDSDLRAELLQHIHDLKKEGYIVLISSHDMPFVESLEATVYRLQNGELV
jgi:polar amino acid transport system ATP-binding protein